MEIGIDIDEIITEYMKSFLEFLKKEKNLFGKYEELFTYKFEKCFNVSKEEFQEYIQEHTNTELALVELGLIEDSLEAINFLDDRHKICFITSRNLSNKEKTFEFFRKHFPDKDFKILFSGDIWGDNKKKYELCLEEGCEVMVEDRFKTAFECAENGIKAILFNKPWNKSEKTHKNLIRVNNWKEALKKIKEVENGN